MKTSFWLRKLFLYYLLLFILLPLQCSKDNTFYTDNTSNTYNHNNNPGTSARDFLAGAKFKTLVIEIQYMPGFKPDAIAIEIFIDLLKQRLNKSTGIFTKVVEINPTLLTVFSLSDISNIESRNRTIYTTGEQMSAYILFTSGSYNIGNIAGLAYKNTSICFFGEAIKYMSIGSTEQDKIRMMAMLLAHEFGHLLGLVNIGSPMVINHLDYSNGNHCINNECLMHHTFEPDTKNFPRIISDNPFFDTNCINDLIANGGK